MPMKKKAFSCIMMLMISIMTCMAQTMKSHTVQRGETLESIAKKYGVTVEAIKEANPNMGGYFYVGMGLKIPEKETKVETVKTEVEKVEVVVPTPVHDTTVSTTERIVYSEAPQQPVASNNDSIKGSREENVIREGTWEVAARFGWHALDYKEGMDVNGWGNYFTLGANYFISEQAYLKICAGYGFATKSKGNQTKGGRTRVEMHNIRIPISINLLIPMGGYRGFAIGAGPYLDYVVYGKSEYTYTELGTKIKTKTIKTKFSDIDGANSTIWGIQMQATLMFSESFGIYGEYGWGLTERYKDNKENYWSVGIAYSF